MVDRKLSQEDLDLLVEYPHPELIDTSITKCERDIQAERDSTILATTFFNEDELPYSPAEPPASSIQDQQQEQPVIMKLSHDLANDQSVQLAILQAQTAAGRASADASSSSSSNGQNLQGNNLYQAGSSLPPQGAVFNASHQQQSQTQPQQAMGVEVPPAVAGADLTSLLAQLSGSGLANLNTGFGSAPPPPPAPLGYGQHQQHQSYHHQPHQGPYSHMQQYSQ